MTKSELFKAAHRLAKAMKAKAQTGDYVVYMSLALKQLVKLGKKSTFEAIAKNLNSAFTKMGKLELLITRTVKKSSSHGLLKVSHEYKLNNAELKDGQFLGKKFVENGMYCAWVKSVSFAQVAY